LFKSWTAWANFNHVAVRNNKALADAIEGRRFKNGQHKFNKDRNNRGVIFYGLRLKTIDEQVLDGVRNMQ
jgi:hypothetical protein